MTEANPELKAKIASLPSSVAPAPAPPPAAPPQEHAATGLVNKAAELGKDLINKHVPEAFRNLAHSALGAAQGATLNQLKKLQDAKTLNEKPQPQPDGLNKQKKLSWWDKLKQSKFGKWLGNVWQKIKAPVKSLVGNIPVVGGLLNTGIDTVEELGKNRE